MKKIVLLLSLFVASLSSAANLTVQQALELRVGIQALDGAQQVVPQGDAPAKIVNVPYTFSADARWKIFTTMTALKPTLDTFEAMKADLAKRLEIANDEKDPVKIAKFNDGVVPNLVRTVDIKLPVLTKADLNLDKNQIPGSVLLLLGPVLKE